MSHPLFLELPVCRPLKSSRCHTRVFADRVSLSSRNLGPRGAPTYVRAKRKLYDSWFHSCRRSIPRKLWCLKRTQTYHKTVHCSTGVATPLFSRLHTCSGFEPLRQTFFEPRQLTVTYVHHVCYMHCCTRSGRTIPPTHDSSTVRARSVLVPTY